MIKHFIKSNEMIYKLVLSLFKVYKKIQENIRVLIYRNSRHTSKILKFKEKHKGERCFIIGTGPSLRASDLDLLINEYTFASHRIFNIYDQTNWRPTYYVAQDERWIDKARKEINEIESEKFLPINSVWKNNEWFKSSNYFYFNIKPFYPQLPQFSEKVEKEIFEGYTVTYAALQLAVYMGFKEIYLLGVDFNYSISTNSKGEIIRNDNTNDYFLNNMNNQGMNLPNLEYSYLAYKAARKYADEKNIKIYYATRDGKLDVFEKVDFDNIFQCFS